MKHISLKTKRFLYFLLFLLLVAMLILFRSIEVKKPFITPSVFDFARSTAAIKEFQEKEGSDTNTLCHTKFLSHGKKTEHAIIFFHGFTSCPYQFRELAQRFYDRGYNVIIPLIPHHGNKNLMSTDLKNLTAEELAYQIDTYTYIATGLGKHVTMIGLSEGAMMTAWAAAEYPEIDKAVIIAPIYRKYIQSFYAVPMINAVRTLPPVWIWWDKNLKEKLPVTYTYPRFPSNAAFELFRVGYTTLQTAKKQPPRTKDILVITNANDAATDNVVTKDLVKLWQKNGEVSTYEFDKIYGLTHDIIAPEVLKDKKEFVYTQLEELIDK